MSDLHAELEDALDELMTRAAKAAPVNDWVGAIWQGNHTDVYRVGE